MSTWLLKRSPSLWLHNALRVLECVTIYDRIIIGSSSEIFGYLWKSSEIFVLNLIFHMFAALTREISS